MMFEQVFLQIAKARGLYFQSAKVGTVYSQNAILAF
jgi:hypothetical protein